jgi:tyrosinase
MDRYVSGPIPLPPLIDPAAPISRTDLVFYDLDPKGESYQGRVFLNQPDADHTTARDIAKGFAGWFTIFGHGGCFGDDDRHCEQPAEIDPFDLRPPRGIPPQTKTVTVTDALRSLSGDSFTVTVVAVVATEDGPRPSDTLEFGRLRLLTYE